MTRRFKQPHLPVETLATTEWQLDPEKQRIPEWQWLPMLNYEYARCYQPVVEAVEKLRGNESGSEDKGKGGWPFTRYLASRCPDFPNNSWSKIPPEARVKQLALCDITENTQFYNQEPAWQTWNIFEVSNLCEELNDSMAENYGIFKINFNENEKVIRKQFRTWLTAQRLEFFKKRELAYQLKAAELHESVKPLAEEIFKASKLPKKVALHLGKEHKKRKCHYYLKALGGLRALKYYEDWSKAEEKTSLYSDAHSWKRVAYSANEMLMILASHWKCGVIYADPFDKLEPDIIPMGRISLNNTHLKFKQGKTPAMRNREAEIKNFLNSQSFTIDRLKTECI